MPLATLAMKNQMQIFYFCTCVMALGLRSVELRYNNDDDYDDDDDDEPNQC